ncbi:MAG: hypothetical protein H7Y20_17295 [Bryobacteraceae bacterium]|nr:hypothetical protein [Bryobacteraceae bacterium]
MANAARVLANRENARLSTGPATSEGKTASSANAIKHGMTSSRVVLPHESQSAFDAHREAVLVDCAPATDLERIFAENIASAWWRVQRMYRIELALMVNRMEACEEASATSGDEALGLLFSDPAEMNRMRLILRYVSAAERTLHHAETELKQAQIRRRIREREQAEPMPVSALSVVKVATAVVSVAKPIDPVPEPVGFVSQPIHERLAAPVEIAQNVWRTGRRI